jgi:hypothetical protein
MTQSFREQAERAERLARYMTDPATCEALRDYARECRKEARPKSSSEKPWAEIQTGCFQEHRDK